MDSSLALGFAVESQPWHLISHLFPDKIGGRPAWLALKHLPTAQELTCPICSNPMCFLLQIYSPINERDDCFHRFLFLFMCRNGSCHSTTTTTTTSDDRVPFAVFRSQLPRQNPYYSYEPPETEYPTEQQIQSLASQNQIPLASHYGSICPICGCRGDKACAKCKQIHYCSKQHQILDWKTHKPKCNQSESNSGDNASLRKRLPDFNTNDFLLPEYRLCSELVDDEPGKTSDLSDDEDEEEEEEEEGENADPTVGADGDDDASALASMAKRETKEEALFRRLKEAMSPEPDQVVRFQRGGQPLWLTLQPPTVPNCEVCGAKRCFEFQVTPQLLHYLKLDKVNEKSPDFGSLYIFTCSNSCALPRQEQSVPRTTTSSSHDELHSSTSCRTVEYQREHVIRQFVP